MNCNAETHRMHICTLTLEGKEECVRSLSDNPTVQCSHCGAKANSVQYVCAAHLGGDAPNVEGGHGSVDLKEVGQPHAGPRQDD